jgi:hypothetical protein
MEQVSLARVRSPRGSQWCCLSTGHHAVPSDPKHFLAGQPLLMAIPMRKKRRSVARARRPEHIHANTQGIRTCQAQRTASEDDGVCGRPNDGTSGHVAIAEAPSSLPANNTSSKNPINCLATAWAKMDHLYTPQVWVDSPLVETQPLLARRAEYTRSQKTAPSQPIQHSV